MSLQDSTFKTTHVMDNEIVKANDFEFAFEQLIENVSKSTQMILESNQDFVINGKVLPDTGMNVRVSPIYGVCKTTGIPFGRTETTDETIGFEGSSSGRRDILEVQGEWETYDNQQRAFNDPETDTKTYQYVDTKKLMKPIYRVKKGSEGSSVAPEVDEGWVKLAEVQIRAGASSIIASDIINITADIAGVNNTDWTTQKAITYNIGYISSVNERFRVQHNADGTHKNNVINTDSLDIGTGAKQINGNVLPVGGNTSLPTEDISAVDSIYDAVTKIVTCITSIYNAYMQYGSFNFNGKLSISSIVNNSSLVKPVSIEADGSGNAYIKINGTTALTINSAGKLTTNGYTASSNNDIVTKAVTDSITTSLNALASRVTTLEEIVAGNYIYINKTLSTERFNIANVSIVVATTANITLSGLQTIDGIALTAGQIVLVKNQSSAKNNGIYTVQTSNWTRPSNYNTPNKLKGKIFNISKGTANGGKMFYIPNETFASGSSFGSDDINFVEFLGSVAKLGNKIVTRDSSGAAKLDVIGNVTGDVTGNVTGDVTGNVTGDVTGNVTGDAGGNAATATKLETARTINIQDADGTNTGTGVSFDGSEDKTIKLPETIKANITGNVTGDAGGNAATATKLKTARTINGVQFNGGSNINNYATCSTAAATAAKKCTCTGFVLDTGAEITVKFTVTNTAAKPTLNVNNGSDDTGAKDIYYRGSAISAGYLAANRTYTFRYNGTQYELVGDLDTNTTYSNFVKSGSDAKAGLVPKPSTTAGTTKYLREDATWEVPPNTTYSTFVKSGSTAAAGLVPKPSTTAGTTKYLREDATWEVPPNTTYSNVSKTAAGLCPQLPNETTTTKYLRQDGSWQVPPNTTYSNATTSAAGLMSSEDKTKLNGIASGAQVNTITGVKGNSESSYRTGNVNITAANIGLGSVDNKSFRETAFAGLYITTDTESLTNAYTTSSPYTFAPSAPAGSTNLAAGSVVRITFSRALQTSHANGITQVNLNYGGRNGPIVAQRGNNENGYVNIASHVFATTVIQTFNKRVWDRFTTLELMWTGSVWLVMGNPVLCSSFSTTQSYTVYANGFIEQWGNVTYSHSFAVRFNNKVVPLLRPYVSEDGSDVGRFVYSSSNTNFTVVIKWGATYTTSNNTDAIEWYAVGY